jgi:hypothetical protein
MGMPLPEFSALLRTIGFKYSYLDEEELKKEAKASKGLLKKRCN